MIIRIAYSLAFMRIYLLRRRLWCGVRREDKPDQSRHYVRKYWGCLFAIFCLVWNTSQAHEFMHQEILIVHPAMPQSGLYDTSVPIHMILSNLSDQADRLLSIETELGPVRLERSRKLPDGTNVFERIESIDLPAGGVVALLPGQMRGRLEGLRYPLMEGATVQGKLIFERRGTFDMFFMVDQSMDSSDDTGLGSPTSANGQQVQQEGDLAQDIQHIHIRVKQALGVAVDNPNIMVGPIVVREDSAIAGWRNEFTGARVLLKKNPDKGWQVLVWSGRSLLLPATLARFGVRGEQARSLRAQMQAAEAALGPTFISVFDSYSGTAFPSLDQ